MRLHQITPPTSHPHVAEITIDPADWNRVQRMIEEARELRLVELDDSQPGTWTVRIGCASERVREAVEEQWG
jgi:hypothetical protein